MARLSAGQKRKQKELKRKRKLSPQKGKLESQFGPEHANLPKLSELLIDYAGPLLEMVDSSKESVTGAMDTAVICWNIGSYPAKESKELEEELISELINDPEVEEEMAMFLAMLIEVRRTVFGKDPRFVMDYKLTWCADDPDNDDDYRLKVFSSLVPPEHFEEITGDKYEDLKTQLMEPT
ncbi:MAG: hypothetical protein ACR2PT_01425 [Endozoicomonas sp.]